MDRRVEAPRRLRRRLVVAFALIGGLSAGVLASASFALVRQDRLQDAVDRSIAQARLNLTLVAANLPPRPGREDVSRVVSALAGGGFRSLAVLRGSVAAYSLPPELSVPSLGAAVPDDLRALVRDGQLAYRRVSFGGVPYVVVGGPLPGRALELYFYAPEGRLHADLAHLGTVLLAGSVAALLLATAVGFALARRVLGPVGAASAAARSLAEGLLDTRLPEEGRDEFGAWAASFNRMAAALEAKIQALSEAQARERRFTADVAHELRTPLTALVAEASLLAEHLGDLPEPARRPAELLVADVGRLRRLVEELMEISRLDAGRESVRPERVDVLGLVRAAVRARGWEEAVRIEGEALRARVDPRRLERAVTNLVGNAVEHGGRDVTIWVGRGEGGSGVVEVADRGPGVAPEHLGRLFDRFYKADPSRTGGGSGLGLAIARENAKLIGGDIAVWSAVGAGTRFTLRFPSGATEAGGGDAGATRAGGDVGATGRGRDGTVTGG